jgi:hypothetical protein
LKKRGDLEVAGDQGHLRLVRRVSQRGGRQRSPVDRVYLDLNGFDQVAALLPDERNELYKHYPAARACVPPAVASCRMRGYRSDEKGWAGAEMALEDDR